jgi:hypothetical protein
MSARRKAPQPTLFDAPAAAPERLPPDLDFIRKHLHRVLRLVRNAESMPWGDAETEHWKGFFPQLTALLPPEEGHELLTAFETELARIRLSS